MELQQIIEGLNCFKTNQHPCTTCPWNPHPGMAWPYGCIKGQIDIIEAAQINLMNAREPVTIKNSAGNGVCPNCNNIIPAWSNPNYCGYCGKAVKWK